MSLVLERTTCIHGHEWTRENTYIPADGIRRCLACRKVTNKRWSDKRSQMRGHPVVRIEPAPEAENPLEDPTTSSAHTCIHCHERGRGMLEFPKPYESEFDFDWIHPKCLKEIAK